MTQTFSCYITKDINKKPNRKNWLDGTLQFCSETAKITVKNESGNCVAERFDDLVFNNFMNNDIIKVGNYEVELANISSNNSNNNSNNNNNSNQRYRSNNNYNSNNHNNNFKQKTRKFKYVVPKFDNSIAKRRKIQNNFGSMNNNKFNQNNTFNFNNGRSHNNAFNNNINHNNINNYNRNNRNGYNRNNNKSFGDVRMTDKTNKNQKNSHIGTKRSFSNENENKYLLQNNSRNNNKSNNISSKTTNTKTENIITKSILDYIEIDANALTCNDNKIYENKQCQLFEDLIQTDFESKDIPKQFCGPYFLPFYDKMPEIIYGNIDDNITMNFVDNNNENDNVDNTLTE